MREDFYKLELLNENKGVISMVRHIVAWNFAEGFTAEENQKNAQAIKSELENLKNIIDGIVSIEVLINPLSTSDSDLLLDSTFENEEALKAYAVHPEHVRVGTNFVKPSTKNRKCMDFSF
jgi:hypothetical protein